MIVSIKKSYPGQARKVMKRHLVTRQAMFTKCIIVLDEDVNVQDIAEVTLKALNHIDPERDIQFTLGPVDFARPLLPPAQLRLQDGHRRHLANGPAKASFVPGQMKS